MELYEWELARRSHLLLASSKFVGMMDGYPESFYNHLPSTLNVMDSDSSFAGSNHPSWECNMSGGRRRERHATSNPIDSGGAGGLRAGEAGAG